MAKGQELYRRALVEELAAHGLNDYKFDDSKSHMRFIFTVRPGLVRFTVFPKTPGDKKGALNARQDLRRELHRQGVETPNKRSAA